MEKIEMFLFDIFGNLIPGTLLNIMLFSHILKFIEKFNFLSTFSGTAYIGNLTFFIFLTTSYLLGNGINIVTRFIFGIKNSFGCYNNEEISKLKIEFKKIKPSLDNNDISITLIKKYLEKEKLSNRIVKLEAKYFLYRNLCFSFTMLSSIPFYEVLKAIYNKNLRNLLIPFWEISLLTIFLITSYKSYKYYFSKTLNEIKVVLKLSQIH